MAHKEKKVVVVGGGNRQNTQHTRNIQNSDFKEKQES